jgi:glycosyltransferase involved in cell wall biosynthesis
VKKWRETYRRSWEKGEMKKINHSGVTVIIPTRNEEKSIAELIQELNKMGYDDVLIVDGNSLDRTVEHAKESGAYVMVQNGRGKGDALRQAFNHADLDGNVVVIMDADGSMNPKEVPLLIKALDSGVDLAKGSRFLSYGYSEDMSLIRKIGNRFFLLLVNLIWSSNYTDLCYGFAAFRKNAIEELVPHLRSKNFEIETEVFVRAKKLGMKVVEVPSVEFRRQYGKSNLSSFLDGFRILMTIFREVIYRD